MTSPQVDSALAALLQQEADDALIRAAGKAAAIQSAAAEEARDARRDTRQSPNGCTQRP